MKYVLCTFNLSHLLLFCFLWTAQIFIASYIPNFFIQSRVYYKGLFIVCFSIMRSCIYRICPTGLHHWSPWDFYDGMHIQILIAIEYIGQKPKCRSTRNYKQTKSLFAKTDKSIFVKLRYLRLKLLKYKENNNKISDTFDHNFENNHWHVMSEVSF